MIKKLQSIRNLVIVLLLCESLIFFGLYLITNNPFIFYLLIFSFVQNMIYAFVIIYFAYIHESNALDEKEFENNEISEDQW